MYRVIVTTKKESHLSYYQFWPMADDSKGGNWKFQLVVPTKADAEYYRRTIEADSDTATIEQI